MLFYVSYWLQSGNNFPIYGGCTYRLNSEMPSTQDLLDIAADLKERFNCDVAGIVGFFRLAEDTEREKD